MLAFAGSTKRLDADTTVGPIDLEVGDGARVALLGASGSGKSTLLRMLVGLVPLDAGAIRRDGRALDAAGFAALRRDVGYLTQDGALWPHLTARANVALRPRELGWDAARIAVRISELADVVRLPAALMDRYPFAMSGGQRQRVALMRALVLGPSVLLLDEPLGALDPITRLELQDELVALVRALGTALLLVTHDLHEAIKLADRIVVLRGGRILQAGTIAELASAPRDPYVTRFLAAQGYEAARLRSDGNAARPPGDARASA